MITEYQLSVLTGGKLLWVGGFAVLYGLGGMNGKWKRRIIGPLWLGTGVVLSSLVEGYFSWWLLLYPPMLYGALSMGYGADKLSDKLRRRALCGLLLGIAALPVAFVTANWLLFSLHIFLCILFSTILGAFNPTSAREEESLIGTATGLLPMFM